MNFPILSENRSNPRYRNYCYTKKTADKVSAEEEEEYESHHTDTEEDDEEIVTTEILSVANTKKEEVIQDEEVADDGKFACDICEKRCCCLIVYSKIIHIYIYIKLNIV
jgi:hypothetical protein